jgi:hypothetical protein
MEQRCGSSLRLRGFPGDEYVVLATEGDKRIRAQDIRQKAEISGPWLVARLCDKE